MPLAVYLKLAFIEASIKNVFVRYFSKENYSKLLERVPYAFLIISGVLLFLDLIGLLLMFENKDDHQISMSFDSSACLTQNSDGQSSEIEISREGLF